MIALLVDDERPAIDALMELVNWNKLGFSGVKTACDVEQAQKIMKKDQIAVLLCDIEMPGYSGLELLHWAQTNSPGTVSILYTCHADFNYAKQAVALGAFDYLLKPSSIETVEQTMGRAAEEWKLRSEKERSFGQWEKNRDAVLERFWLETVLGELPENRQKLMAAAAKRELEIPSSQKYLMLLCAVRQWNEATDWQVADLDFAFRNILTELFTFDGPPVVISDTVRRKLLLLPDCPADQARIEERCRTFLDVIKKHFGADVCFYVGRSVPMEGLAEEYRQLKDMERQNVSYNCRIFWGNQFPGADSQIEPPAMDQWQLMLERREAERLCAEVYCWLDRQVSWGKMNAHTLALFYHDFLQMLYTVLTQNHISVAQLSWGRGEDFSSALTSLENMKAHLKRMVYLSCEQLEGVLRKNVLVEQVKEYIDQHLAEDLSRDLLAGVVYLNTNYLSRLFHQQTGQSLVDYITHQRIEKVKMLLRTTSISVTDAAGRVGYTNMPYFSRVFKRETGCSPMEYRRGIRGEK